jgi:hypothetical protein
LLIEGPPIVSRRSPITKKSTIAHHQSAMSSLPVLIVEDKDSRHSLSTDRRTSILERESRIEDGVIYNFWKLTRGDPKGRYSMRIMIEGLLVSTFEFDVE